MTCHKTIFENSPFLHIRPAGILRVFMPAVVVLSMMTPSILSVQVARSAPLRYQPRADTKFAYEVEITAELPDKVETSKGVILYEVKSTGEIVKLKYSGGLKQTSKTKASARHRFGPPPFPRPFGFGSRRGSLMQKTNRISLTPRGDVRSMEGDSQLPYVLGNLSTFIFEPLPENDQKSWTSKTGVSLLEGNTSNHHFPPWRGNSTNKTTAGSESTSFVFQSDKGYLATFRKTYRLHSVEDKESMTITGSGVWTFNRRLNVPESLECKYNIVSRKDNVTLNLPCTVKYHRLSDDELAKIEKEKEERLKKSKAENEKRLVEQKAPIDDAERRRILADLKSNDTHHLISVLRKLSQKTVRDDKVIARAIKRHLKSSSRMVRRAAEDAIVKFAPELGRKIKINKAYSSIHKVDATGPAVTARTPLPAGLIVAVNDHGHWYKAAKVIRKHNDGQVEVESVVFHQVTTIHWSKIRLAPREVDQPFVSKRKLARVYPGRQIDDDDLDDSDEDADEDSDEDADDDSDDDSFDEDTDTPVGKSDRGYRTWTDSSGTFVIIAKYIKMDGDKVCLQRKKDGKTIKVPLARLSKADKKMAQRLKELPQASNPFDP